jgi:hypothetical protein
MRRPGVTLLLLWEEYRAGQLTRAPRLSRDSRLGQRKHPALCIQLVHGLVDRPIKCVSVSEGLMGEMVRLEIMPNGLDVVQFWDVLSSTFRNSGSHT